MKKYFITGLIILAPLALTVAILMFFFNLLTGPFAGIVAAIFDRYNLLENGFLFLNGRQAQELVGQILVLIFLFAFTVLLGAITRYFFVNSLLRFWDYTLNKIPVISTIYKLSQDVIKTLFGSKTSSFKQVVMVPYPAKGTLSIGLLTCEKLEGLVKDISLVTVFVPTAPNPTSGFLIMFKPEDVIYLDMKVEDAFKYVISCGVIMSPFSVVEAKAAISDLNEPPKAEL